MKTRVQPQVNLEEVLRSAMSLHVGFCMFKVGLIFRGKINERLEEFGVISPQYGLLNILKETQRASQIDLGHLMRIDKASMVKMVDGLEELKYVRRVASSEDRRVKYIELTAAGQSALKKMNKIRDQVEEKFLEDLTEKEKKSLKELLHKLMSSKINELIECPPLK